MEDVQARDNNTFSIVANLKYAYFIMISQMINKYRCTE